MTRKTRAWRVAMVCALIMTGCDKREPAATAHPDRELEPAQESLIALDPHEARAAGIQVKTLEIQGENERITLIATIKANQDKLVRVAPRVAGRIVKVNANLGDRVRAKQELAFLDSIELGEANSAYLQAQSESALAKADLERAQRLLADSIVPRKDYLRARSDYEKARAALRAATIKLQMLGVDPGHAAGAGSVFPLLAPFAGTVIEKQAVLGQLAQPDQSLFTVADLSVLWIEADLFEKDLGKVAPGASASINVSAYPGESFEGRLTYISSTVDPQTRTVKARVEVPNLGARLKPGMFSSARTTGASVTALWVPEQALLLLQGQLTVFIAKQAGYEPRAVEIERRLNGLVAIKSGVLPGEAVVVAGAFALKARLLKSQIGEAD